MIAAIHRRRSAAAITIAVFLVSGCRVYNAAKQVRTVADMQTMCARVEAEKEEHRPIDEVKIKTLVGQVARGRDGWGNQILVATRDTPAGLRYLLVSTGSDGQLDVGTPARYFDQAPTADVKEDTTRDIVFIDAKQVTNAGK